MIQERKSGFVATETTTTSEMSVSPAWVGASVPTEWRLSFSYVRRKMEDVLVEWRQPVGHRATSCLMCPESMLHYSEVQDEETNKGQQMGTNLC